MKVDSLYFVDVQQTEELGDLRPGLVSQVHMHNSSEPLALLHVGLAFPNGAVRIFGTKQGLEAFSARPQVGRLLRMTGTGAPRPVPEGCPLVRVSRDNRADKFKPSSLRRMALRAEKQGRAFTPSETRVLAKTAIQAHSSSRSMAFHLLVKAEPFEGERVVVFNAYGLCKEGGVPFF